MDAKVMAQTLSAVILMIAVVCNSEENFGIAEGTNVTTAIPPPTLAGHHVCSREQQYNGTRTVAVTAVAVRVQAPCVYGWFWRLCYKLTYRMAYTLQDYQSSRNVSECCLGYEQLGSQCVTPTPPTTPPLHDSVALKKVKATTSPAHGATVWRDTQTQGPFASASSSRRPPALPQTLPTHSLIYRQQQELLWLSRTQQQQRSAGPWNPQSPFGPTIGAALIAHPSVDTPRATSLGPSSTPDVGLQSPQITHSTRRDPSLPSRGSQILQSTHRDPTLPLHSPQSTHRDPSLPSQGPQRTQTEQTNEQQSH
ncbi:uncharacterized protein LOC133344045 [Lethenteron reissneri]|uniref:uncharacterized protein LOC133344045 n=1 Tax=Lethenteron reissneri TaxID=7753 RepID=UPI002AB6D598|nr:uncharacterized protein LOC133344045 [Lethenteron reissneri]